LWRLNLEGFDLLPNKALHPTAYSSAVSLVPRFTLALPAAGELGRSVLSCCPKLFAL